MDRGKATSIDKELMELVTAWAKERGLTAHLKGGTFDSVSTTFSVELTEQAADGLPAMSDSDKSVMELHLKNTPWNGKDPRGHVFHDTQYKTPHRIKILNFKYGTYPWKVLDLTTGKEMKFKTAGINWNEEV